MNESQEATLVLRCQAGDNEAFCPLVEQYRSVLFGTAYLMIRDRGLAEDAEFAGKIDGSLSGIWPKADGFTNRIQTGGSTCLCLIFTHLLTRPRSPSYSGYLYLQLKKLVVDIFSLLPLLPKQKKAGVNPGLLKSYLAKLQKGRKSVASKLKYGQA